MGIFPLATDTISGSASSVANAPLSCRPPWFETTIPETRCWRARRASSAVAMPLTHTSISGAHCWVSQAMSRDQFRVGLAAWVWKVMGPVGGWRVWGFWGSFGLVLVLVFCEACGGSGDDPPMTACEAEAVESSGKLAILYGLGSLNWLRISMLRRPSMGVSTVRKTAL